MPVASLDDIDLHYEIAGDQGPWLVFAHGGGDNQLTWWRQVARLKDRYRCVTYDARWHGRSGMGDASSDADTVAATDLVGLMDAIGIDRAFLNGHSMGGVAISGVALAHPERVLGLIYSCTALGLRTPALSRWAAMMAERLSTGFAVMDHLFAPGFAERDPEIVHLHRLLKGLNPPRPIPRDSSAYRAVYERMRDAPPADFSDFAVPALFIAASEDALQFPWLLEAAAAAIPGARIETIAGAGHNAHLERPDAYLRLVEAFLEPLSQGERTSAPSFA